MKSKEMYMEQSQPLEDRSNLLIGALLVLQNAKGVGLKAQHKFIESIDAHLIQSEGDAVKAILCFLSTSKRFEQIPSEEVKGRLDRALDEKLRLQDEGIDIVSIFDDEYPWRARIDGDYPVLLYCRGDIALLNANHSVAIIGTREPSDFVSKSLTRISQRAVEKNFCVVSGLALGCDSLAHQATLKAGGKTIAVLAGCLLKPAPAKNRSLAEQIVEQGGLLVSEYPPSTPSEGFRLVARDRLQSMFADGLVLGQSSINGGSMHATKASLKLQRPVGVVISPLKLFEGNAWAIENGGVGLSDRAQLNVFFRQCICPSPYDSFTSSKNGVLFDFDNTIADTEAIREYRNLRDWPAASNALHRLKFNWHVVTVMKSLQDQMVPIAIVTNSPRMYVQAYLNKLSLSATPAIGYHETKQHKPHPEPLLTACSQLNINPEHAIYIGDEDTDSVAAQNAGMHYFDSKKA